MDSTSSSSTIPLISQVGGHAGVQSTQDGSLIIKPALGLEHQFYQSLTTSSSDEGLGRLRPFVPKFYGTLKLEGELVPDNLVLENLSHPFSKPNILDIKLGTVLYDESAPPDKVERMLKTARQTTSLETGVRLTGFQVYDNSTSQAVNTPKSYGKSIKPSDLPDGIAKFFPIPSDTNTSGLPPRLLLPILENIKEDIQEIREAVAGIEMRMVGGSCLIIYEADWEKAEEGVDWLNETPNDEEEEEESEGEEEGKKKGPPYVVKLIDFAHTRFKSGEGPDEGVLKGLDTVLRLLDGRIGEVKKAL
ncbi:inositol polyphosphate multikinase [Moniliophthora roreri MCA 2997]|uniref:Kinase n=1 Tax=Moniliophthora roreri (strain MCA 2997) TaxID=1381753 RepID=V2YRB9_MONRO|nr:inositol polyphosphate multikinase [Moniliophthora roreri MCA 2997]